MVPEAGASGYFSPIIVLDDWERRQRGERRYRRELNQRAPAVCLSNQLPIAEMVPEAGASGYFSPITVLDGWR
ncbi:MAG: hypothetical protein WB696_09465 [Chthoniobacterales bacterium]